MDRGVDISREASVMKIVDMKEFVRDIGGFVLSSQKIKVHTNGAKITISKAFIKHGLLTPEQTYTIILVPEENIETGL